MFDLRPAVYVIGLLVAALGGAMGVPMMIDLYDGNGHGSVFALSAVLTMVCGASLALATANSATSGLTIQQTFFLTTGVWVILPIFGALPFILGATGARPVDAYFEAMSGLTTTGATAFSGLENLPRGLNLWRAMSQWFGGIGIVVVAMAFLPVMRVGGMQFFRSEAFDTFGKVLPRAAEIASRISVIYIILTFVCFVSYRLVGMDTYRAAFHALTTMSTGGFSDSDASFAAFKGLPEYVCTFFMLCSALPYVRYVQLIDGSARPLFDDSQIRAFFGTLLAVVAAMVVYRIWQSSIGGERAFREAAFNIVSIMTGTG
ncbi:MAG: potassium transporter TrkG, partial [Pseudomonadota bacterium]